MKEEKKLLFIGASLIEYYDWQKRFPEHIVLNLGIAGETVDGLYARLDTVFQQTGVPDCIFIMTGLNNLAIEDRDIINTYRKVIKGFLNRYPSSRIYIHSLLPVLFPLISNDEIRDTNSKVRKMSEEEGAFYVDIHSMFLNSEGMPVTSFFLEDGVHVSEAGYRVWSDEIESFIS